jgi:pimeloyl-ACP methyl ester carboxylesterase
MIGGKIIEKRKRGGRMLLSKEGVKMSQIGQFFTQDGMEVQYSIRGTGIPILVLHGGHSNCFEDFGYQDLIEQGYSLITPSRAGYGRTSRELGKTLGTACEAYVELLQHLNLEKVHVLAISAGGPSGIFFASRYPEHTQTLTLQSAVTCEFISSKDKTYIAARMLFRPGVEKYIWKLIASMTNLFPSFILRQMAPSFSKLSWSEVRTYLQSGDLAAFRAMNNRQRSGYGFFIDMIQSRHISTEDMQQIQCPTLIMHSKNDQSVPMHHAHLAKKHIPGSQLCMLDTWGHLIWLGKGSEQVTLELLGFLKDNTE